MKNFLCLTCALFIYVVSFAQHSITGKIVDEKNNPLVSAVASLTLNNGKEKPKLADDNGSFSFTNIPSSANCILHFDYVGKRIEEIKFVVSKDTNFIIILHDVELFLTPLEVSATRASAKSPFTKLNISKEEIAKNNFGQDLPFILNNTPSVVVNSDAGNGVGYTGIHIRGSDATRINVTLNGIPFNDPESHATYFVDMPDFASSASSIQIQRGVGTSTNGPGAFGATINISTNETNKNPYAESNNNYGSFNTWKNTIKFGSGIINNHFSIDGRLSSITSDGYIDRAKSNLESFYLSAAYKIIKSSLRFNIFSGKEKTYQAWYGVPQDSLATNRTFNPAGTEKPGEPYNNQTDNYTQTHYQLFFDHTFTSSLKLNVAAFLIRGAGYYEEYKSGKSFEEYGLPNVVVGGDTITSTNVVRQLWLDNYFYGNTFALQYNKGKDEFTVGGNWSSYDGKHFGKLIWGQTGIPKDYQYYYLLAYKKDMNAYAKWQHNIDNHLSLFTDIQYRFVKHDIRGFEDNPQLDINRKFNFINPKAGISYNAHGWNAYISYALAHKEPNRSDFEANPLQQPLAETLHDFEAGIQHTQKKYSYGATLYYMPYKNQLVLTGKINDVGSYTRTNTPNSYRLGIELQGSANILKWMTVNANLTLSQNKIKSFNEYVDDYDAGGQKNYVHSNTDISFSPAAIASATVSFTPFANSSIDCISKYVGKQYMDNTQNNARSLAAYYTENLRFSYAIKNVLFSETDFTFIVNNIFNRLYQPNGYTYPYVYGGELINDNYYYPMAGSNFMVGINLKF